MKKLLLALILFSVFKILYSSPVLADYQQAYSDYTYQYSLYRTADNNYQISKSTYLTYKTLTAQNDAIDKLRATLKARASVMSAYYALLQEKLNSTPGIPDDSKNTFYSIKNSESDWLSAHQKKIDAAASLDDLNLVSSDFESRYPQMDTESKQTIGTILLAKESYLKGTMDSLIASFSAKLSDIRQDGTNTSIWDRGVINTKNKLDLYQTKIDQAHNVFFPKNNSSNNKIDLFSGQQRLTEANQYLREAESFLMEIVKAVTG